MILTSFMIPQILSAGIVAVHYLNDMLKKTN